MTQIWQGVMEAHGHYGNAEQWSNHGDVNKQGYYPGYTGNMDKTYHTNNNVYPAHVPSNDVMTCEMGNYSNHVVPMTSQQLTCETMVHPHLTGGASAEIEHWHLQMMSQTDPFLVMPLRDGCGKRKRRRVISREQRTAANVRERNRMNQLNDAFDGLRKRVPTFAYEKKLSRIETLNLAVNYIRFMAELLENNGEKCKEMIEKCEDSENGDKDTNDTSDEPVILKTTCDDVTSTPHGDVTIESPEHEG